LLSPAPDASSPNHTEAGPPLILEYGHAKPRAWGERVALGVSALITGCIGLVMMAALIEFEILNWPSFGVALAAVPIGCIAAAFLLIANTAAKAALYEADRPARGSTFNHSPTE
jgi:hypothetical protein